MKTEQIESQTRQNYIVTGGGEILNVFAKNAHAAIKCFRDTYPEVNAKSLKVTTHQSHE